MLRRLRWNASTLNGRDEGVFWSQLTSFRGAVVPSRLSDDIIDLWNKRLDQCVRRTAVDLVPEVKRARNVNGYDVPPRSKTTQSSDLMSFIYSQKRLYPEAIHLFRIGQFYEAFGHDAIMLIEHVGLNPMSKKPLAGFPLGNIQSVLDCLTEKNFVVAVHEESLNTKLIRGKRSRFLAQLVSPLFPIYRYNTLLSNNSIVRNNEPSALVAIHQSSTGLSLIEICPSLKEIKMTNKLSLYTLKSRLLSAKAIAPVLFLHSPHNKVVVNNQSLTHLKQRVLDVLPMESITENTSASISLPEMAETSLQIFSQKLNFSPTDFKFIHCQSSRKRSQPLVLSSAIELGLCLENLSSSGNSTLRTPSLLDYILPYGSPTFSIRVLQRWLIWPPPYFLATHIRSLVILLQHLPQGLPQLTDIQPGTVLDVIASKSSNYNYLSDLLDFCENFMIYFPRPVSAGDGNLETAKGKRRSKAGEYDFILQQNASHNPSPYEALFPHLIPLIEFESNFLCNHIDTIKQDILSARNHIQDLLNKERNDPISQDPHGAIPSEFFEDHENKFRNRIKRNAPQVEELYKELDKSVLHLVNLVQAQTNALEEQTSLKKKQVSKKSVHYDSTQKTIGFNTKNVTELSTDFTKKGLKKTKKNENISLHSKVEEAVFAYKACCEKLENAVAETLTHICSLLMPNCVSIVQAIHMNRILHTLALHSAHAAQQGWTLPSLEPINSEGEVDETLSLFPNDNVSNKFVFLPNLIPYWLNLTNACRVDVNLHGVSLFTSPNMSGKSTVMRSILAACVLANCGLFVPCVSPLVNLSSDLDKLSNATAYVPRLDGFIMRTSVLDSPVEGRSSFAQESDEIAVIANSKTPRTLLLLDELTRGTSSLEGTALSGALLEHLANDGEAPPCLFASHLHELFHLPLEGDTVSVCTLDARNRNPSDSCLYRYNHKMELKEGYTINSYALETAREFGVASSIIQRSRGLLSYLKDYYQASHRYAAEKGRQGSLDEGEKEDREMGRGNIDEIGWVKRKPFIVASEEMKKTIFEMNEHIQHIQKMKEEEKKGTLHSFEGAAAFESDYLLPLVHVHPWESSFSDTERKMAKNSLQTFQNILYSLYGEQRRSKASLGVKDQGTSIEEWRGEGDDWGESGYGERTEEEERSFPSRNSIGYSHVLEEVKRSPFTVILPGTLPSNAFYNHSCCYVIAMNGNVYVGETENLPQRLEQHHKTNFSRSSVVIAFSGHNKTKARLFEKCLTLVAMQTRGVHLTSDHDAKHTNFSSIDKELFALQSTI